MEHNNPEVESSRKRQPKLGADKALPTTGIDRLLLMLKGYVIATSEGASPSGYKEVSALTDINANRIAENNSFFEENGFLRLVRRGQYVPDAYVVKYVKEEPWDDQQARLALRSIVEQTWFFEQVANLSRVHGSIKEDQAINALGRASSAPKSKRTQLRYLWDMLMYVGVVVASDEGTFTVGAEAPLPNLAEAIPHPIPKTSEQAAQPGHSPLNVVNQLSYDPPGIHLNVTLNLPQVIDDSYLQQLTKVMKILGLQPHEVGPAYDT